MKRTTVQWIRLTAVAALLAAGCAARTPQRSPGTPMPMRAGDTTIRSTITGDIGTCAAALGHTGTIPGTPGATAGITGTAPGTANTTPGTAPGRAGALGGILIGNVALVTLPAGGPAAPPPNPGAPNTVAPAAPGLRATPVAPGARTVPGPAAAPGPAARPEAGRVSLPAGTDAAMITRIRTACPGVAQIRVVADPGDQARLTDITTRMRGGAPTTDFLDELTRISRRATPVDAGPAPTTGGGVPAPRWGR
jgi:hypothetical protein